MPYESNRDKEIFSKDVQSETGKIVVSVHSYNNGPKKLQITREVKDRDGQLIFAKLGRLSKDETEGILPLIREALEVM
jgi:hypothetical protein